MVEINQEQEALDLIKANVKPRPHRDILEIRYSTLIQEGLIGNPDEFKQALWRLAGKGKVKVSPWCHMRRNRGIRRDPCLIRVL
jgi:hypothetical protein